jgi:hypothetical protein
MKPNYINIMLDFVPQSNLQNNYKITIKHKDTKSGKLKV